MAVVVGVIAWLTTRDGDEEAPAPPTAETQIVDEAELPNLAAEVGHPVYWAGPIAGTELELTNSSEGGVEIRYLEEGAEAGEETNALTIGSYPLPDPQQALEAFAEQEGAIVRHSKDGRKVVSNSQQPTSVYFISPENTVQVEVYDPSAKRAMELALSGQVRPAD